MFGIGSAAENLQIRFVHTSFPQIFCWCLLYFCLMNIKLCELLRPTCFYCCKSIQLSISCESISNTLDLSSTVPFSVLALPFCWDMYRIVKSNTISLFLHQFCRFLLADSRPLSHFNFDTFCCKQMTEKLFNTYIFNTINNGDD